MRRKIDKPDKAVLILPGKYSSITAGQSGNIELPIPPKTIPNQKIKELKMGMLPLTKEEKNIAAQRNSFLALLDKTLSDEKSASSTTEEADSIVFTDNTFKTKKKKPRILKKAIPTPKLPKLAPVATKLIPSRPKKGIDPTTAIAKQDLEKSKKKPIQVAAIPKKKEALKPKKVDRSSLFNQRFDIDLWAKDSRWIIIQDIFEKKGTRSLVRFIRHHEAGGKKKTKLSTLDAIFYDKKANAKMIAPSKKVEKLTTRVLTKDKRYKGNEIEFLAEPGKYLISIDNGPITEISIAQAKDMSFKTSAFISPGSNFSVFNKLTQSYIPFRDKGHPIFVLPSKYKISKGLKNKMGVFSGKKKFKTYKVEPNVLVTPDF